MPAGNVCDNCNFKYELAPENTVIYFFECQPWFSFGAAICPACGVQAKLFFRDCYDDYMEQFILQDFGFVTEDFAPFETVTSFERVYSVHEIPTVEINKRHELELQNLHTVLANVPDEILFDLFTDPMPPKSRPDSWA